MNDGRGTATPTGWGRARRLDRLSTIHLDGIGKMNISIFCNTSMLHMYFISPCMSHTNIISISAACHIQTEIVVIFFCHVHVNSNMNMIANLSGSTHTHTHIYIYTCICMYVYIYT